MSKYRLNKHVERNILRQYFNTERDWDKQAEGGADGENSWCVIEIFARPHTKFLWQELQQAIDQAQGRKLPVGVWHEKGKNYDDAIVYMRLKDFYDYFGS